eukprot:gnl/TRDRNA2_/TRDRNA2_173475_c0_seq11.p1 gnl/TRDRNA2_/TRDRNA2_173475_c0~~gnl/TRDRNA2_/TRDRNA2_173475_c0_seq11.p1  ORF type:complete len:298 (-),score=17.47 gnl/TRDRNA2_/TRDRNA2_173475_c0_seq11:27-920(-)
MDARRDPVLKHFMKCLTTELRSYTTVERKVRFIAAAIAAACGGNPSANQADAADYEVGAKKKTKRELELEERWRTARGRWHLSSRDGTSDGVFPIGLFLTQPSRCTVISSGTLSKGAPTSRVRFSSEEQPIFWKSGNGYCRHRSVLFKYVVDKLGICPAALLDGEVFGKDAPCRDYHCWNAVNIHGKVFLVDGGIFPGGILDQKGCELNWWPYKYCRVGGGAGFSLGKSDPAKRVSISYFRPFLPNCIMKDEMLCGGCDRYIRLETHCLGRCCLPPGYDLNRVRSNFKNIVVKSGDR